MRNIRQREREDQPLRGTDVTDLNGRGRHYPAKGLFTTGQMMARLGLSPTEAGLVARRIGNRYNTTPPRPSGDGVEKAWITPEMFRAMERESKAC